MSFDYIVVQAGGKGTRLERLTRNKPKALVPIGNLPMIFHLFQKYPKQKFIVIGDYKEDVFKRYLKAFANVDYSFVSANGHSGTCSGLKSAFDLIPDGKSFLLIWCDLVLPEELRLPDSKKACVNYVGLSKDFPCRWKFENGVFSEERSIDFGVAGLFLFSNKDIFVNLPEDGEFVNYLSTLKNINWDTIDLYKTHEYGLIEEWNKLPKQRCRPFNKLIVDEKTVTKVPVDEQGKMLAEREVKWYKYLKNQHFNHLPEIYSYSPLCMERINGKNIYELSGCSVSEKKIILKNIISCLRDIHNVGDCPFDEDSFYDAYVGKTFKRLEKVKGLVPFSEDSFICVNGKSCPNVFGKKEKITSMLKRYKPSKFVLIHGDCTFSNIMVRDNLEPVFIDPRGYFGKTELFGDPSYDWVKLYYSLASNYDQFNLKRFDLTIEEHEAKLTIASNGWEELEPMFFELLGGEVTKEQMKLLLAITWLSLTTYAWEDYDSICGAFYQGILYLSEVIS